MQCSHPCYGKGTRNGSLPHGSPCDRLSNARIEDTLVSTSNDDYDHARRCATRLRYSGLVLAFLIHPHDDTKRTNCTDLPFTKPIGLCMSRGYPQNYRKRKKTKSKTKARECPRHFHICGIGSIFLICPFFPATHHHERTAIAMEQVYTQTLLVLKF